MRATRRTFSVLVCGAMLAAIAPAQTPSKLRPDWRRIGSPVMDLALASPASGPVDRAWYSSDGSRLFVRTHAGKIFETNDFEKWQPGSATPPPQEAIPAAVPGSRAVRASADPQRLYAFAGHVLRSDDGGLTWANVTSFERRSIIGEQVHDLAVSPRDPEELVAVNESGVWRSLDAGVSWAGLNESLPNFPARHIAALPVGSDGVRLQTEKQGAIEWLPGEKREWRPVIDRQQEQDFALRRTLAGTLRADVTAAIATGDFVYAGSADGRLWVSFDKGRSWTGGAPAERGAVEAIFVDSHDPRLALAALERNSKNGARLLRTTNAGQFWDDLTADLPDASVHGIAADRASGTLYAATDRGLFLTKAELNAAGPATPWSAVQGLPEGRVLDARLDADGNQLYVLTEGYGLYAAMAPHRLGNPRLVNGADFSQRAAAPGSLLSVLGARVRSARAGDQNVPVLATTATETQIQVPFAAKGSLLSLALDTGGGSYHLAVPLAGVSPAIFVDRDGTPLVLNADTGVLLDARNTAHSNSRVQILMTGLGGVRPEWPSGVAAPLEDPPQVIAPVHVFLDRAPVEVTRAVLAPGYVGLYLVEVQLPALVNSGPAELYIESESHESNRVRVWIEP